MLIIGSIIGPFIAIILCFIFGRYLDNNLSRIVLFLYLISSLFSFLLLYNIINYNIDYIISILKWSSLLGIHIEFSANIINVSLLSVIITVGTCVISYTIYYMSTDAYLNKFIGLLSCFVLFMAILALSNNLIVLFIGWELIGLFSYLLIGFWSDRTEASTAALNAMLTNKWGDYFLSLGLIFTFSQINTLDFNNINLIYNYYFNHNLFIFSLSIMYLIATMAKSAQIGLHIWLISAMQGPTPVSSLLHAATLVVAGPILLFKVNCIVNYNISLIVIIGIITALLGSILALIQQDIKGVIAYSTMSQFGYIISIAALSSESIANLHITTHAMFKACLFMAAGVVIHAISDIQDNRKYGGLVNILPIAYIGTLICSLSLIAIPYTAGSISKDLILEIHASQFILNNNIGFIIGSLVASITALYSIKLIIITYNYNINISRKIYENIHTANFYAFIPIIVLSLFAIILGYLGQTFLIDSYGYIDSIIIAELFNLNIRFIPIILVLLGIILAIIWSSDKYNFNNYLYRNLAYRLYWPSMYSLGYLSYLNLGSKASKKFDLGILELIGPYGMYNLFNLNYKLEKKNNKIIKVKIENIVN